MHNGVTFSGKGDFIMKKFAGILLTALLLCALCIPALADEGVSYLNKTVANGAVQTEQKTVSAVCVNATAETWGSDGESWYVLDDNITLSCRPQILGTVNLILMNGKTLTAPDGITLEAGNILNVYAQSDDVSEMGEINAAGTNGNAAIGGRRGKDGGKENKQLPNIGEKGYDCGTLNWHGGKLTLTNDSDVCIGGGRGGKAGAAYVRAGHDRLLDNSPSGAGAGGNGGIVNIYGGAADLRGSSGVGGGNGGEPGGAYELRVLGVSGGMGGTLSVWGGTVRIQSTDGVCFGGGRGGEGSEATMDMSGGGPGGDGGNGGTLMLAGGAISFVRLNGGSSIGGGAGGLGGPGSHIENRGIPGSSGRGAEITITGNPVLTAGSSEQDSAPVDRYKNEAFFSAVYPNAENTASVLSEGNIWIIVAVVIVALGGVAAVVIVKKKQSEAIHNA